MSSTKTNPTEQDRRGEPRISRIIREHGQVLSGLIAGLFSLGGAIGGAMIISGGVEKGVERGLEGNEDIAIEVQGFNSSNSTDRRVIAHNYGGRAGTLMPDVEIIVRNREGEKLDHISAQLNEGLKGYEMAEPFTLSARRGMTYYLPRPDTLSRGAAHCVLLYRVKRSSDESRTGESPSFACTSITAGE